MKLANCGLIVESNVLKSNFCYHILLFKIFVEIDSKSIQVCNLLIINGSSEMTPEIQTILNLLCGSAVCCKEEVTPVDGHVGDQFVSPTFHSRNLRSNPDTDELSPKCSQPRYQ